MDYIIKKTDYSSNGQFTIKPYTTNGPALPTQAVPLDEHAVSANTSLILLGKGMYEYGDIIASNFVHLLENFAGPTAPVYPLQGQLWYKNTTGELFIYDNGSFSTQNVVINNKLVTDLNVNNNKITNLLDPVNNTDAVTKGYVDTNFFGLTGGSLALGANITLSSGELFGLPDIPSTTDAATSKKYVDDQLTAQAAAQDLLYYRITGGTITGSTTISGVLTLSTDPVNPLEAATKQYVDNSVSGTTAFVKTIGDTMTGQLTISGTGATTSFSLISVNTSTNTFKINGDQTSIYTPATIFKLSIGATAGYQEVDVGGAIIGTTPTGLLNDSTIYTASCTVDGGTPIVISITGSSAQTYTTLINEIQISTGTVVTVNLTNGNILFTSGAIGSTSSISLADTDLFSSLTDFVAINSNIPGIDGVNNQQFTVDSSVFNSPDTDVTVTATITIPSFVGDIDVVGQATSGVPMLGLYINNATSEFNGDVNISGSHILNFGNNRLRNIATPTEDTDAVTKAYVDALLVNGDGTLVNVTFENNTLSFINSINPTITVTGVAEVNHKHIASDINYDVTNIPSFGNSVLRDTYINHSTYPAINMSSAIETLDTVLYKSISRNKRSIYEISTSPITDVAAPLSANLTIISITSTTITVSGGDYTTTFLPDTEFIVINNTGEIAATLFAVDSSVFNLGNTEITVVGTIPGTFTNDGNILQMYGAYRLTTLNPSKFIAGMTINVSGNTGGGNGNFVIATVTTTSTTTPWLYMDSSTPLPPASTGDGSIIPHSLSFPFDYVVEHNKLHVTRNGVKLYNSTRGSVSIYSNNYYTTEIEPLPLVDGTYTFDVTIDGGSTDTISLIVAHSTFTIIAVDDVENSWTITGIPSLAELNQFVTFQVINNTGLGATTTYTIKSYELVGSDTKIFVYEDISNIADVSGSIEYPYTYATAMLDIQSQLLSLYPSNTPRMYIEENFIYLFSNTLGTGSSVLITNDTFFSGVNDQYTFNYTIGSDYGYKEDGDLFTTSNVVTLTSLPNIGDVYELINMG